MRSPLPAILGVATLAAAAWIIRMALKRISFTGQATTDTPETNPPADSAVHRALVEELVKRERPAPKYVVFVDMLGFSQLTEDHPRATDIEFDADVVTEATSPTDKQLGGFQYLLNTLVDPVHDEWSPSHMMAFSDCAFLVYDNALHAALSARQLMRWMFELSFSVPVRMGIAHGTWYVQRFSFDSVNSHVVTRAVFYGTAVVRAHVAESKGGKGCRIFLHSSIDTAAQAQIRGNVQILDVPGGNPHVPLELNYLYGNDGSDDGIFQSYLNMYGRLKAPISPDVEFQYGQTLEALNRMRAQLGQSGFVQPTTPSA